MMKVLEVFGEPISNGGQESFVINFLRHMDLEDMEVDLLTPYYCDNHHYEEIVKHLGGKIVSFGLEFAPGKARSNIRAKLSEYLSKNQYDVVHVHSGSISVLVIVAQVAKQNHVKKVLVHSHCGVEHINLKNIVLRTAASLSFENNVDEYCACSQIAGEAKYVSSVTNGKMTILKNGIDFDEFALDASVRERIRKENHLDTASFVIGHVGRFSYQKNHDFLIDIFVQVRKEIPVAKLLLIGSGELEQTVKEKVQNLNLSDSVLFIGNVNNVNEYMQAMDVFLLPSRFEGLPIVGVEAQGAGLPIITSTNVSREIKLTEQVHFISLQASVAEWAKIVIKYQNCEKKDNAEILRKKGYDIHQTAVQIRSIYWKGM